MSEDYKLMYKELKAEYEKRDVYLVKRGDKAHRVVSYKDDVEWVGEYKVVKIDYSADPSQVRIILWGMETQVNRMLNIYDLPAFLMSSTIIFDELIYVVIDAVKDKKLAKFMFSGNTVTFVNTGRSTEDVDNWIQVSNSPLNRSSILQCTKDILGMYDEEYTINCMDDMNRLIPSSIVELCNGNTLVHGNTSLTTDLFTVYQKATVKQNAKRYDYDNMVK